MDQIYLSKLLLKENTEISCNIVGHRYPTRILLPIAMYEIDNTIFIHKCIIIELWKAISF